MAINLLFQPCLMPQRVLRNSNARRPLTCHATTGNLESATTRRSANYHPNIWTHDVIQSLKSDYQGVTYMRQVEKLKEEASQILDAVGPLAQLELIDCMERLGVGYHFEKEIKEILDTIWVDHSDMVLRNHDLHATALSFRLFRQHGYKMSQDGFSVFMEDTGRFKERHCNDIKGMLSLYDASYLSIEGEDILDEAKIFTCKHLKALKGNIDPKLERLVEHSLELPLHWRALRPEARWFIDTYERMEDMSPTLLELAMLDFNMVQGIYQENLRNSFRWWNKLGLDVKMSFARDRLMECFLWTIGVKFEPQFGRCREVCTKINQLITTIDDVYDVYGSLDELELFTDAVDRWDTDAMVGLPEYMKICFLSLHNTINEIAYDTLREQGWDVIPYLKKSWANLCKTYLVEAKWYYNGYTPTLNEYLDNAWTSISGPVVLIHAYVSLGQKITKEALESVANCANIVRWSSMILRLSDDLGTSTAELKRGDVPKSIQCYMHETSASEVDARKHIRGIISDTWKKLNEAYMDPSPFPKPFSDVATNLARTSQFIYQYGDGFGIQTESKDRIMSLLVEPIPLMKREYV